MLLVKEANSLPQILHVLLTVDLNRNSHLHFVLQFLKNFTYVDLF